MDESTPMEEVQATPPEALPVDPHECQYPDGLENCLVCGKVLDKPVVPDPAPQAEIVTPPTEGVANEGTTTPTPEGAAVPTDTVNPTPEPVIETPVAEPTIEATPTPDPGGRPTKYKDTYPQELVDHMNKGFTFESFAGLIDVNKDTLYEWKSVYPLFSDAHKNGVAKSLLFWEKLGVGGSVGQIDGFNTAAWIFNMKNKHKWTDRQEVTGNEGAPLAMVIDIVKQKQEVVGEE